MQNNLPKKQAML